MSGFPRPLAVSTGQLRRAGLSSLLQTLEQLNLAGVIEIVRGDPSDQERRRGTFLIFALEARQSIVRR